MEFMNLFAQYHDIKEAIEVVKQYKGEFLTRGLLNKTITAIKECTTPKALDTRLGYLVLTKDVCSRGCKKSCGERRDPDGAGFNSLCTRFLEGD